MTLKDKELVGKKFGRLTLLYRVGKNKWNDPIFKFKCDCGVEKDILYGSVRRKYTQSCGCLNRDNIVERNIEAAKHNLCNTSTYKIWGGMKNRCYNKNSKDYFRYGGRGIKMSESWLEFINFYRDMGERPTKEFSVERRNNNGNYEASNCYWLKKTLQARNRRGNHLLFFKGETKCIAEWSEITGIKQSTISRRINNYGWSIEAALTTAVNKK